MTTITRAKFTLFLATFLSFFLISCNQSKISIDGIKSKIESRGGSSSKTITVTSVDVVNNQLVVKGINLDSATSIKVTGPSGFAESFAIESKNSSQLIANSLSNITMAVNGIFSLIVSNAQGAATYTINFELQDGQVTAAKLSDMGAVAGDVLSFDGSSWGPAPLSGLNYQGTFDPSVASPQLSATEAAGHYYIATTTGTNNPDGAGSSHTFDTGDWAVYNGSTMTWDKVIGANDVTSVAGKTGDVSLVWNDVDKTGSTLESIADINISGRADGDILVWDSGSSTWIIGQRTVGTNTNAGTLCNTGEFLNGDGACQAIPVDTDTNAGTLCNSGEFLNGDGACQAIPTFTDTNAGTLCNTGEFLNGDGTCQAIPVDTTLALDTSTALGTSDVVVPSQNAVKTYVDAATGAITSSQWTTSATDIYYNTGSVGIGTTTPDGELHIQGATHATLILEAVGIDDSRLWFGDAFSNNSGVIEYDHNLNKMILGTTDGTADVAIDNAGNMGIGVLAPTEKLEVAGNIKVSSGSDFCIDGGACLSTVASGSGEVNTASNVGSAGVGVFKQKASANLEFKNINSNGSITVTDDAANNEIDLAIASVNVDLIANGVGLYLDYRPNGTNCTEDQILQYDATNFRWECGDKTVDTTLTLDTTTTLGTSDLVVPSQNAVKTYVDAATGAITSSQWTTSATDIYYNTGSVGIGTTTPDGELHIQGATHATLILEAAGIDDSRLWFGNSFSNNSGVIEYDHNLNKMILGTTDGTADMAIDNAGNVGIGVLAPTEKLEVAGNIKVSSGSDFCIDGGACLSTVASGSGEVNTASNVGSAGVGVFKQKASANLEFKNINSNGSITVTDDAANNEIDLAIASVNVDLIANGVGLYLDYRPNGTNCTEDQILQYDATNFRWECGDKTVDTTLTLDTTTTLGTSDLVVPSQNAVKTYVDAATGAITSSQWTTSATDIYYNTGSVGIGTTTPDGELHIQGATHATLILEAVGIDDSRLWFGNAFSNNSGVIEYDHNLNKMILGTTDGTADMAIDNAGNVGIGVLAPTEKLEVAGNIKVSSGSDFCIDGGACLSTVASGSGEVNTASNVGSAGVGVFKQKASANLEFKNINSNGSITVTDDAANNEIDLAIASVNVDLIANGVGLYLDYRPNGTNCTEDQILQYDATNFRWECGDKTVDTTLTLDTTTTLGTSDLVVPSQNAVKTYVDAATGAITSSQWTTSATDIYYNTGSVGIGITNPRSILDVRAVNARPNFTNTSNALNALTQDIPGLELLIDGNQNAITQRYGMGIKFMAGDNQLTTENEKFVAGIFPAATETIDSDEDGGHALEFFVTENQPGINNIPNRSMIINQDGNVGIGNITTPPEKLTVRGVAALEETTSPSLTNNYGKIYVKSADSKLYFMDDAGVEYDLLSSAWSFNGTDLTYTGGQVGIGTASPQSIFHINQPNAGVNVAGITATNRQIMMGPQDMTGWRGNGISLSNYISGSHWSLIGSNADSLFFGHTDGTEGHIDLQIKHDGAAGPGDLLASGKIGVGTTTDPMAQLDLRTDANYADLIMFSSIGADKIVKLHYGGNGTITNEFRFGRFATNGSFEANVVRIDMDAPNDMLRILENGRFGINTSGPTATLSVNGTANKPGGGSWAVFSDARLKDVHGKYVRSLEALRGLQAIRYNYKEGNEVGIDDTQTVHVGFIAQDVRKVIPEAVTENHLGFLEVNNDPIIWTMFNGLKELDLLFGKEVAKNVAMYERMQGIELQVKENSRAIASLKEENAELKAINREQDLKIQNLEERLKRLESLLLKK
jgi:carbon monoxide dehydrogenase subunit G